MGEKKGELRQLREAPDLRDELREKLDAPYSPGGRRPRRAPRAPRTAGEDGGGYARLQLV